MGGEPHHVDEREGSWYVLDLREHQGRLLLQVWATVPCISSKLCPEVSVHSLIWPGHTEPMTEARLGEASARTQFIYLDDRVLEHYQQTDIYNTVPRHVDGRWLCSPSYKGQWSFGGWIRVGRNLIRVPIYDIYNAVPDRESRHVHSFATPAPTGAEPTEEHVVAKGQRLVDQLLDLGNNLSALGDALGLSYKAPAELVGFSRAELATNGWDKYPRLCRLTQVAPLSMTQQAFLARCKTLHEILQRVPNSFLKQLLIGAGCKQAQIKDLGSIRLMQALTNILVDLDAKQDDVTAFAGAATDIDLDTRNPRLAALFVANELRKADAHEAENDWLLQLEELGFDTAQTNDGYGRALDFVLDRICASLGDVNQLLRGLLER